MERDLFRRKFLRTTSGRRRSWAVDGVSIANILFNLFSIIVGIPAM